MVNHSMREDGPSQNSPGPKAAHPDPDTIGENAPIGRLEAVLEEYTWQLISAPDMVKQINKILEAASEFDDAQRDAARDQYIERMEEAALHCACTITRGGQDGDAAGPEHPVDPPGANGGEQVVAQAPRVPGRVGADPASSRMQHVCEANDDAARAPLK